MNFDSYQVKAARTINNDLNEHHTELHALHGICAETGEIHSIFQKQYQGHDIDDLHLQSEIGDLLWFISELCNVRGYSMKDIAINNIEKLAHRYPEGFEERRSLLREDGDI